MDQEKVKVIRLCLAAYLRSDVIGLISDFDPTILTARIGEEGVSVIDEDVKSVWATMEPKLTAQIDKIFVDAIR